MQIFSHFVTSIILSQVYSIHSSFPLFVEFLKIIDWIKFQISQIYFFKVKIIQNVMSICCQKKVYAKKIILVTTIFGGLACYANKLELEYKSLISLYIWRYTMMVKYINETIFTKSLALHLAIKNLQQHCIFRLLICRLVCFFQLNFCFIKM
jgi:hypothetical protein